MSYQTGPRIVTNGLVFCVDAADANSYPGSGTTWTDLSGNGNNGTLTNGPTFNSANRGSIVFDGTNDYVNCSNNSSINITGNFLTLSAWINKISWNQDHTFIHKDFVYTLALRRVSNVNVVTYADGSNWSYLNFGYHGSFLADVWYNIVAVKNGTNITIYSNNTVVVSKSFGSSITGNSNSLIIGAYNDVASNTFYSDNARISQVSIYNRALSATEVAQNYNATKGRYGF